MSEESIKYLISADDNATVKFQNVRRELENSAKSVKDFGGKAKAATEFTGSLANALGGTTFAQAASTIADITGKVSALTDILKTGGIMATAFKAALITGVVVTVYSVTRSIYDAIAGTEQLAEATKRYGEEAARSAEFIINKQQKRLALELETINALTDSNQRQSEGAALVANIEQQIKEQAKAVKEAKEGLQEMEDSWSNMTGFGEAGVTAAQQTLDVEQKRLDGLRTMLETAKDSLEISQSQTRELLKQRQAEAKGEDFLNKLNEEVLQLTLSEEERNVLLAEQNTATQEQFKQAMALLEAKREILAAQEAEKVAAEEAKQKEAEAKRLAEQAARDKIQMEKELATELKRTSEEQAKAIKQRIADMSKVYDVQADMVASMKQQLILQRDGDVAAKTFALTQKGVSQQMAEELATFENRLKNLDRQANAAGPGPNTAFESRLLTMTPTIDQRAIEAKRLQEINQEQKKVLDQMDKRLEQIRVALLLPNIVIGT